MHVPPPPHVSNYGRCTNTYSVATNALKLIFNSGIVLLVFLYLVSSTTQTQLIMSEQTNTTITNRAQKISVFSFPTNGKIYFLMALE